MGNLKRKDPEVYRAILEETKRENDNLELIASENFVSEEVLEAQGSVMTNKYAEGYPGARWYNGCHNVDIVEELAIERAKKLFGAEHVNVQPHSGTQANMVIYFAMLKPGDTVLSMDLACGGHLSHGHTHNFSGKLYNIVPYGVSRKTEMLDYDEIASLAKLHKPKMILAGASAYPRLLDFKAFRRIADSVGAILFVDMAHIAGLIAAGLHQNPVEYAEFVTSTTHKTMRGPRGGFVMCRKEFAKKIDQEVFPGLQGGPLMHVIAAKAVCFKEALQPEFKEYQKQVLKNSKALSSEFAKLGYRLVARGTDTHLFLLDLTSKNITGKDAATVLDRANITVNKNLIPFDTKSPFVASGVRIGSPAITTRGMKEAEMRKVARLIDRVISDPQNESNINAVRSDVKSLAKKFPLYKNLVKRMEK
ncbi:MAG: serine hydroxymethyltransferase [Candidatus Omnitrophica bacterium]|nr:serine hydroxymethyltransferase [Candidatus Omnitrophota bacterium]